MRYMLDLFSGLGGASEAFFLDPDWSVLRLDNNHLLQDVPGTVIKDITSLDLLELNRKSDNTSPMRIDVVWASPPCTEFSGGFASPKSIASRSVGLENYEPDMTLLEITIEIIEKLNPKFWIIENVKGSIRYFKPYLGEPRQIIGPYVLWGNFPLVESKLKLKNKADKDSNSRDPLRSNKRAKVDLLLSQALKDAIESQTSLFDFQPMEIVGQKS